MGVGHLRATYEMERQAKDKLIELADAKDDVDRLADHLWRLEDQAAAVGRHSGHLADIATQRQRTLDQLDAAKARFERLHIETQKALEDAAKRATTGSSYGKIRWGDRTSNPSLRPGGITTTRPSTQGHSDTRTPRRRPRLHTVKRRLYGDKRWLRYLTKLAGEG